jgi:methylmalonyl-CoA mutase
MTTPPDQLKLATEFPEPSRAAWRELVTEVLRKQGVTPADPQRPEDELASTTYDGITIAPLYTADALTGAAANAGLPGLSPYVRGAQPGGHVDGGWDIRARYTDPDPAATNTSVLADLEGGVSSVWLTVGDGGVPVADLPRALEGVMLDLAPVVLDAGADFAVAAEAMLALYQRHEIPPSEVRGNLGADPIGLRARTGSRADVAGAAALAALNRARYPGLRTFIVDGTAYHDAGASDAQELGCSLATSVAYLRALTDAGLEIDAAFDALEHRFAVTDDQFLGIAKMRAARRLWDRVGEECGASAQARAQRQHAVTASAMMTERDPWVNMLRTTVGCFAAGIGGADAVTVQPFDARLGISDSFARRIARNSQTILLEESKLAGVIDPAGGSWYVESLTDELARAAWAVFTGIEADGGMLAALDSGKVQEMVGQVWASRRANVANRTDPITGVNEFPNLGEKRLSRKAYPEGTAPEGSLRPVHYAQDYEALRTRSDAHLESSGERPKVFLATIGPIARHTARATFANNLFNAGGIETLDAGATESDEDVLAAFEKSGAPVACICGADADYTERVPALAPALAERGARRVLLAGKPDEQYESGVDGFVHTGCDALSVLTETLDTLGVR